MLGLKDEYTVMHIGAIWPQKNHSFLLEVIKEITNKVGSAILILVGDGALKEEIAIKIKHLDLQNNV